MPTDSNGLLGETTLSLILEPTSFCSPEGGQGRGARQCPEATKHDSPSQIPLRTLT